MLVESLGGAEIEIEMGDKPRTELLHALYG